MRKDRWVQLLLEHKEEIIEKGTELYRMGLDWDGLHYAVHLTEHGEVTIECNYTLSHLQGYTHLQVISLDSNLKDREINYSQVVKKLEKTDPEIYDLIDEEFSRIYSCALLLVDYPELEEYYYKTILERMAPEVLKDYEMSLSNELIDSNAYTWALEQWNWCHRLLSI